MKTLFQTAAVLGAALLAAPASAEVDLSQLGLSRSQVEALNAQLTAPVMAPGIAFGSPVGFGAAWHQAFFSVGGQTQPTTYPNTVDGGATLGFGIGDPGSGIGLETAITAISVYEGLATDGNVNLKAHRLLGSRTGVAIGVDNVAPWGNATKVDASTYVAVTHVVDLMDSVETPWALSMNLGAGNHRFTDPGQDGVGVFGSVAVMPMRQFSVIADWTGRDLNAGISVVPVARWPVVVTAGAINLTQRYGLDTEFAGGVGVLFKF